MMLIFICLTQVLSAQTNYWNGSVNHYWHNNNNWSLGHIPLATENVVITTSGLTPYVDYYDDECNNLTINAGATLHIADQTLTVHNDVSVYGTLEMTSSSAKLYTDDITWQSGSSAAITASATMYIDGNWIFSSGANVQLNSGYVDFQGSTSAYIRTLDSDCSFNHIRNNKSGAFIYQSSYSTQ
ncbi:MAG: hypothetical protein K8S16_13145, partial [Bacteroidales bacterium]|nr:hypothetical protein [Bacteroidales bacterium]